MTKLQNVTAWTARRAGGRITINGKTDDGEPIKLVGVDTIAPSAAGNAAIATRKDGQTFRLCTAGVDGTLPEALTRHLRPATLDAMLDDLEDGSSTERSPGEIDGLISQLRTLRDTLG
jgi:hypothetical protein